MTDDQIKKLVTDGKRTALAIKKLTTRLNQINKALVIEAASRPDDHEQSGENDGTIWTARGVRSEADVIFPTDSLKEIIQHDSEAYRKITKLLDDAKGLEIDPETVLFQTVDACKPHGADFRKRCVELLGAKAGKSLVKLCTKDSTPRVLYREVAP